MLHGCPRKETVRFKRKKNKHMQQKIVYHYLKSGCMHVDLGFPKISAPFQPYANAKMSIKIFNPDVHGLWDGTILHGWFTG